MINLLNMSHYLLSVCFEFER